MRFLPPLAIIAVRKHSFWQRKSRRSSAKVSAGTTTDHTALLAIFTRTHRMARGVELLTYKSRSHMVAKGTWLLVVTFVAGAFRNREFMHIEAVTLRKLKMRLKAPFETSFGITRERTVVLVELLADGVTGWGEVTTSEGPFFNSETPETAWLVIRGFLAPLVLGKDLRCASDVTRIFATIRGHEMARAGIENALWDTEAQQKNVPLAKLLGGTHSEIKCGVSLGLQPSPEALLEKVGTELHAGYQRIKLKIKPG